MVALVYALMVAKTKARRVGRRASVVLYDGTVEEAGRCQSMEVGKKESESVKLGRDQYRPASASTGERQAASLAGSIC